MLGPAARDALDHARGPMILVFVASLAGAAVFWVAGRGRRAGTHALSEAACPVCLTLGWLAERPALGVTAG